MILRYPFIAVCLSFFFVNIIKCAESTDSNAYILDTYDEKNAFIKRYFLRFDYETMLFYDNSKLYQITNSKSFVICEGMGDKKDEQNIILLWNTSILYDVSSTIIYLNAFPFWSKIQKEKNKKSFCLRIENVGWVDNVNAQICVDDNPSIPCPDLIILGTTQFSSRYYKGELLSLNKYFRNYLMKNGKSIESMLNKYSHYDYRVDNNWLAVPLIVDFRMFRFNPSTFDYCIKKGYDLHYPPPYSNYWGKNYRETWTWEKVIEYAEIITKCTGKPGFRIIGTQSEDTKLFITMCQSLGIPFIIEDTEKKVKMSGFRKSDHVQKLSIIKKLFENHYIEPWLDENAIKEWQNKPYPRSVNEQPVLPLADPSYVHKELNVNGMMFDILISDIDEIPDTKYSYMPGTSSFLGGSGIVITKKSKFPDEAFEYIETLIKYNYFLYLNVAVTPFENINGNECNISKKSNKDLCNLLIGEQGLTPYFYIYNKEVNVVYMEHLRLDPTQSFNVIKFNKYYSGKENTLFTTREYVCDDDVNYSQNKITYNGSYKLEFPIGNNETLILKSMTDYNYINNIQQFDDVRCNVHIDTLSKAKPMQFPYNTFSELDYFERKFPISLLFAHLYYKHNKTNEGTFEAVVNECCDIIDDALKPYCKNISSTDIKFSLGKCDQRKNVMTIEYLNCKLDEFDDLPRVTDCQMISNGDTKGLLVQILYILVLIIEVFFFFIIIRFRNDRSFALSGIKFLLSLLLSTIILDISVGLWIGKLTKYKCVLKIWAMIIGITGFICSYSIKSNIIIYIYKNKNLNPKTNTFKSYILYIIIFIIQIILLIIWSCTQEGVVKKKGFVDKLNFYEFEVCSTGNEIILSSMFVIDLILLIISILLAYIGRKIPAEFNYSKKIFITSLMSSVLLLFCYIAVIGDIKKTLPYFVTLSLIIFISLVINIIFIGKKVLVMFNFEIDNDCPVILLSYDRKDSDENLSNEELSNEELSNEELSNEELSNEELSNEELNNEGFNNEGTSNEYIIDDSSNEEISIDDDKYAITESYRRRF